jgi:cell division protein ZapD
MREAPGHDMPATEEASPKLYYEYPLNERIRAFLRLEFLFKNTLHCLGGHTAWDSRATLQGILEILGILGRNDLKAELIKELERRASHLARLKERPGVDRERLVDLLRELDALMEHLYGSSAQFAQDLRENDFLASIRQRSAIPGGTCEFDLPGYHFWLQQDPETRYRHLSGWFNAFEPLYRPITLILFLIRQSARPIAMCAERGFLQQNLDPNLPYQMMRVALPDGTGCFPEISAGRHRYTIRFLEQASPEARAVPTDHDVHFELACCTC